MSNQELKRALSEPTSQLFQIVVENLESLPTDIAPEALLARHARLNCRVLKTWQRFEEILMTASDPKEICVDDMLDGMISRAQTARKTVISDRINELPRPSQSKGSDSNADLHEMLFAATDRFLDLSSLRPGKHGSLFTFREELKAWLLQSEGFRLVYESPDGQRTQYGVYIATLLPPSLNMIGPEFARLSSETRDTIVTHLSESQRGSCPYDTELRALISSKKTLPCILLQCVEFPPGLYQCSGPRSGSASIHVEQRQRLTHPPGLVLPVPPALPLKRQSAPETLPNTLDSPSSQASPATSPYALRPSTSAQTSRNAHSQALPDPVVMSTDKPPKVASGPALADLPGHYYLPAHSGPLSTLSSNDHLNGDHNSHLQTGFSYDGRWFSRGKVNTVPAGSHNWIQQSHQNLMPCDAATQIVPFPPLQNGMRDTQVQVPQYGPRAMGHWMGFTRPHAQNNAFLMQNQARPAAVYRSPQFRAHNANHVQDQNAAWNSSARNTQATGRYRSAYQNVANRGPRFANATSNVAVQSHQDYLPPRRLHPSSSGRLAFT